MDARSAINVNAFAVGEASAGWSSAAEWHPVAAEIEAKPHGFRIARRDELAAVHAASEAIMGMTLTPLAVLKAAHEHTGAAAWIKEEAGKVVGVILTLPLTPQGEEDLLEGAFMPSAPQFHQLSRPGDAFPAIYFWLFAGGDGRSRRAILRTSLAWRNGVYAKVRGYARAASPAGREALGGLGFTPMQSTLSDLFSIAERS